MELGDLQMYRITVYMSLALMVFMSVGCAGRQSTCKTTLIVDCPANKDYVFSLVDLESGKVINLPKVLEADQKLQFSYQIMDTAKSVKTIRWDGQEYAITSNYPEAVEVVERKSFAKPNSNLTQKYLQCIHYIRVSPKRMVDEATAINKWNLMQRFPMLRGVEGMKVSGDVEGKGEGVSQTVE